MIDSPESMISEIRRCGILPLSKGVLPGWSVQEMTDPDFWFTTSDEIGPWDWKIDVLETGNIIYGKFMRRRASFATLECYRHLMNWRRSQSRYRMALGDEYSEKTLDDRLMRLLSPSALSIIREYGSVEPSELRRILDVRMPLSERQKIGGHLEKYFVPSVRRQGVDFLLQFLDMGTWVVNGGFQRVFRGPNLEYSGWQKTFMVTPEGFLRSEETSGETQPWVVAAGLEEGCCLEVDCSPEESREFLAWRVVSSVDGIAEEDILKLI
jgi:hypothetical protein